MQCKIKLLLMQFVLSSLLSTAKAENIPLKLDSFTIEGRWDMTIQMLGKAYPSWLEVRHSGHSTLVGQFVGTGGSARPISRVNFSDKKISFALPQQWERGTSDLFFEGTVQGDSLTGTLISSDGKNYSWTATRAPSLPRQKEPL